MAQIDAESAQNAFGWVGLTIFVVLSLLGGGTLVTVVAKALLDRYWKGKDDKQHQSQEANAEQIKGDTTLAQYIMQREQALEEKWEKRFNELRGELAALQTKFDQLQQEHSSLMARNAGLEKENEFLQRDNDKLTKDLAGARERIRYLEDEVTRLKVQIEEIVNRQKLLGRSKE